MEASSEDSDNNGRQFASFNTNGKLRYSSAIETKGDAWKTLLGSSEDELEMLQMTDTIVESPSKARRSLNTSSSRSSLWTQLRSARRAINIEPAILLSSISGGLFMSILPIFMYWARCVELLNTEDNDVIAVCASLSNHTKGRENSTLLNGQQMEDIVQMDVATLVMWIRAFRCIPGIISSIILGAWADDDGGRKSTLMIAYMGIVVANFVLLFATFIYQDTSVWGWIIFEELIAGFTGAGMTEFAIQMSMITDDARLEEDSDNAISFRVSIATGLSACGSLIGSISTSLFSQYATRQHSYAYAMIACSVVYIFAVLYTKYAVHETFKGEHKKNVEPIAERLSSKLLHRSQRTTKMTYNILKSRMFEVYDTLSTPRSGHTRLCLNITVALVFVELLALDNGLFMLYVKRQPFNWTDVSFTYYVTFTGLLRAVGQMFLWPYVISRYQRIGLDSLLIIGGLVFAIVSYALLSIAQTTTMIYISGFLQLFSSMMSPGFRAFIPKMVNKNETARIFTAFGIVVMIAPILSSLIFNTVYKSTLHIWAGFAFALVALMQVVVLGLMIFVHTLMLRTWRTNAHLGDTDAVLKIDAHDEVVMNDDVVECVLGFRWSTTSPALEDDQTIRERAVQI